MAFTVRRYGKSELAAAYGVSLKTFVREIGLFVVELEQTGYTTYQKSFTPKQVRIIMEHLGDANDLPIKENQVK